MKWQNNTINLINFKKPKKKPKKKIINGPILFCESNWIEITKNNMRWWCEAGGARCYLEDTDSHRHTRHGHEVPLHPLLARPQAASLVDNISVVLPLQLVRRVSRHC